MALHQRCMVDLGVVQVTAMRWDRKMILGIQNRRFNSYKECEYSTNFSAANQLQKWNVISNVVSLYCNKDIFSVAHDYGGHWEDGVQDFSYTIIYMCGTLCAIGIVAW